MMLLSLSLLYEWMYGGVSDCTEMGWRWRRASNARS